MIQSFVCNLRKEAPAVFIIEWYDAQKDLHQLAFDNLEDAQREAKYLETIYVSVAIIAEIDV